MPRYDQFPLSLYNSLGQKKENFTPITEGFVGMYVCGPTVYNQVHLGNVRTFLSFDILYRYLLHLGYRVRYVRNITDVGHLENDADEGEDRIAKKARLEQLEPMEVAQRYTIDFHQVLEKFNLLPPNIEPRATGHVIEQIEMVQQLMDKGYAYESAGSVYFDVHSYNQDHPYGILSGRDLENVRQQSRDLDGQSEKRSPNDFALWKKAQPNHIMRWPSPWSDGFPGWHVECSAMGAKYLGKQFDIHGGGMDLKFPHHECEIAQSHGAYGETPVRFWLHSNMLTLNGQKMAKSTGNHLLPGQLITGDSPLLSQAFSPSVVRFFMLQAHYRSVLDFSNDALLAAEKGFSKLVQAKKELANLPISASSSWDVLAWEAECYRVMGEDLNTPILIAQLFEAASQIQAVKAGKQTLTAQDKGKLSEAFTAFFSDVLGLIDESAAVSGASNEQLQALSDSLLKARENARVNKDWALSDMIRDIAQGAGAKINDGPEGSSLGW